MFHHSSSRNQRSKGSNVKKILQVVVLLAVACWLLYQVKHSREKKIEYAGNDEKKLSNGGEEISLGRKGDAGSENVIIIDTNALGSDESTEIKQDETHHASSDLSSEDKPKETSHNPELEDTKKDNLDNGDKESAAEEEAGSHVTDGEETLHLPDERDGDNSSHQNENSNEGVDGTVANNVEATMAGEAVTSENAGKVNEEENGEEIVSVDGETLKGEGVDENIKSLSETSDDNKIDHADGSDDDHVRSSQDDAASTNDQINDVLHAGDSAEFNSDTSLQNANGASKEGEVETRPGNASEVENTDNSSSGETKIDGDSEKEIESSSSNGNEEQETSSEAKNDEVTARQANNEERREVGEAGDSENSSHETSEETGKSPDGIEQSGADDQREDIAVVNAGESQQNQNGNSDDVTVSDPGIQMSGAGNEDNDVFHEEGKSVATSNDEALTSSEVKEKIDVDDSTNELPTEETIQVEGSGNKSEAESTNDVKNTEEVKTEQSSNVEIKEDDKMNSSAEGEAAEEKAVL